MSMVLTLLQLTTILASVYVLILSVCQLNMMDTKTPGFVFCWYAADAAGAALVLAMPVIDMRSNTLPESVFVIGAAIAFYADKRRVRARRRNENLG